MKRILVSEETLDPAFVPPRLVHRERELRALSAALKSSLSKGVASHRLITGGIGSGKTALAKRLAEDLLRGGPLGEQPVRSHYVNCWRRSSDRTVLLELLRSVGTSIPDRGYSVAEMLDVFEQGIRRAPAHRLLILDEASALVRGGTKLIYLLTRSTEVGLGSISLVLVASEDVLPFLDGASRSSFGPTHRLHLAPYDAPALAAILAFRAELALRPGSVTPDLLEQIAQIAAPSGDARFALEVLYGAARTADEEGAGEIAPDHVRAARGSIYPTMTETKLEGLSETELFVLLALSRTLKGPRTRAPTDRIRGAYQALCEEHDRTPVSRVTFWRTLKALEREAIVQIEPGPAGRAQRIGMDEVPASVLTGLLEGRLARPAPRNP